MKKINILLSAVLITLSTNVNGQNTSPWPSSGYVGIGTTSPAAALEVSSSVPYTGSGGGDPALKIDHSIANAWCMSGSPSPTNFMEIWNVPFNPTLLPHGCSLNPTLPPPALIDVINGNGYLGIMQPNPGYPLDVNGNGNIAANLTVGGNGTINQNLNVGQNGTIAGTLAVQGGLIDMSMSSSDPFRIINANSGIGGLQLESGPGAAAYQQFHAAYESDPGAMTIVCGNGGSGTSFYSFDGSSSWTAQMQITPAGQVVIGADLIGGSGTTPAGYDLYVEHGILTEMVKVALSGTSDWSDFVFNKDYKLKSLNEVESYIKTNKHLPEVPSANEVVKDGIDVAGMDAKLLQKIEELTLYVIDQQKQLEQQKREIDQLKKKMD